MRFMLIKKITLSFIIFSSCMAQETFHSLIIKSDLFDKQIPFPTQNNRIKSIAKNDPVIEQAIQDQANHTYPIIHGKLLDLINDFLAYKNEFGTTQEKELYKDMHVHVFMDRLLLKRPIMFMTEHDTFMLRDKKSGNGGFDHIEFKPMLKEYISYDEMQISALLGVSTPTFFINNGSRTNKAINAPKGSYQEMGIYVGLVGARFERPGLMEWQHIIITPEQNTSENGYGFHKTNKKRLLSLWEKFYDELFPTFDETQGNPEKYLRLAQDLYFNISIYRKRMKLVIAPFLINANTEALRYKKKAYCHVVGLGLGVWQKTVLQAKFMLEAYAEVIQENKLEHIADINFSWFPKEFQTCGGAKNLETLKLNGNNIKIHFSSRNPADKLINDDRDKLLVAMYAWDANAFPGNEYWDGMLSASGDPAAACCSTIAELQNPLINNNISGQRMLVYGQQVNYDNVLDMYHQFQ